MTANKHQLIHISGFSQNTKATFHFNVYFLIGISTLVLKANEKRSTTRNSNGSNKTNINAE